MEATQQLSIVAILSVPTLQRAQNQIPTSIIRTQSAYLDDSRQPQTNLVDVGRGAKKSTLAVKRDFPLNRNKQTCTMFPNNNNAKMTVAEVNASSVGLIAGHQD